MNRVSVTVLLVAATVSFVVTGCSEVAELALDDSWAIEEIQAGDLIKTDVSDFLVVSFDAATDTATISVGPDWSTLSDVDVSGTFDLEVDNRDLSIRLLRDGELEYTIGFTMEDAGARMVWTRWTAASRNSGIDVVGGGSPLEYIAFERRG